VHPARRTLAALLGSAVLSLAACGDDTGSASAGAPADPPADAVGAASAFPVTIEHRFGETVVEARPERVVTVGLTDHDALLALGVVPVGVTDWYGEHPDALWPWARAALARIDGAEPPVVVADADTTTPETIAAQRPDLILALYSGLTAEQYDALSQIAPVVAAPEGTDDYGMPWQDLTRTAGRAVGELERAEEVVAEVEAEIAAVRRAHPEWEGASAVIATPYEGVYVYGEDTANNRLLRDLGFEIPPALEELTGDSFGANVSLERTDLLDTDLVLWLDAVPGEGPLAEPVYTALDVHREGREVLLPSAGRLGGASFVSALSIPFLLDELVPMLEAAVDGDPSTAVPTEEAA